MITSKVTIQAFWILWFFEIIVQLQMEPIILVSMIFEIIDQLQMEPIVI